MNQDDFNTEINEMFQGYSWEFKKQTEFMHEFNQFEAIGEFIHDKSFRLKNSFFKHIHNNTG